jgi:superfamily II DNA or RNA helicase/HKD family nuclease
MELRDGFYDQIITQSVAQMLAGLKRGDGWKATGLGTEETAERLGQMMAKELTLLLDDLGGDTGQKTKRQLALFNGLIAYVRRQAGVAEAPDALIEPPQLLRSVSRIGNAPDPPETGLAFPWLFTAGKGSPSLLTELRLELGSCDQADVLVSFITVSGVRKLFDILQSATAVDAHGVPRTRVRVLTTTYIGATEMEALDSLGRLPGCEIKVSLDGRRTRLHAKAWIFQRRTGFGSAYVGSANLSGAALLGGLEWTVKFTEQGQGDLFERAKAHFETLWNDDEFQLYNPNDKHHRAELSRALKRECAESIPATMTFFDIQPKGYQQEMLEQLTLEREHKRFRNLVVAATGTGKTVVAAFDYRSICSAEGGRPRLLFVAHRKEILAQARRTYREVLRDHSFGEILSDGASLESFDHLFATIDSVCSRDLLARFGADYWHTMVIDECHRMAADRFDRFVGSARPKILLGLTATPERSDGKPIYSYFDNRPDGSPAVELRLWSALDLQLLCPFEYYGCDDDTDFSNVPWEQPGELSAIDQLVTGNDTRARLVIDEWSRLSGNPARCKALVFCVTVAHANFMARKFNEAGIPAVCVTGETDKDIRRRAPARLASGELSALVTCDLYNEGVDLPAVDTLLLLRPTQSPVLFQQQIGRGLRLHPKKDTCLVLDFVGRYRSDFRFDRLFSSLTGLGRSELIEAVEKGFNSLPPGCHIQLQKCTREQVLGSLRTAANQSWRRLRAELQSYVTLRGRTNVTLTDFLREQVIELEDIYRATGKSGWTVLRRDAGLLPGASSAEEEYFGRRFSDLMHFDDSERADLLSKIGEPQTVYGDLNEREQLSLQSLAYQIDAKHQQNGSGEAFLERLSANPEARLELIELGKIFLTKCHLRPQPIPGLEDVPLSLHANYGIREILTAVGWWTAERRSPFQSGVLALQKRKAELLFVTLDKSEGYHERISYRDYAISTELFHWQSQNSASPETPAGKRYLESPANGWSFQLFARRTKGSSYRACGPVVLQNSEGAKPMSIVWKLQVPLPPRMFSEFSILRG